MSGVLEAYHELANVIHSSQFVLAMIVYFVFAHISSMWLFEQVNAIFTGFFKDFRLDKYKFETFLSRTVLNKAFAFV